MALGFQGFDNPEFKSPEEIMNQFKQGLQQASVSGNKDAMRMAIAKQAGWVAAGGSGEYKRALKQRNVLTKASKFAKETSTGDAIQDQINFFKAAQEYAVDGSLPEIAMKATQQLANIELMQEQRKRLKVEQAQDDTTFEQVTEQNTRELDTSKTQIIVDNETGEAVTSFDTTDASDIRRAEGIIQEGQGQYTMVSMDDFTDLRQEDRLARMRLRASINGASSKNPTHLVSAYGKQADSALSFAAGIDQFADIVMETPDALSLANTAQSKISDLATQGKALANASGMSDTNLGQINSNADLAAITDKRVKSAVIELAFAIASSREGGKLTDRDIQAAVETIGVDGNPNPAALSAVLVDVVSRKRAAWTTDKLVALTLSDDPEIVASQQLIYNKLLATENKLRGWRDSFRTEDTQVEGLDNTTPGPGTTQQQSADHSILFGVD